MTGFDVGIRNKRWRQPGGTDAKQLESLVRLRNALGHGNETELRTLIAAGEARDSITWARARLPVLNRYARAADRLVWDHLKRRVKVTPWM